MLYNSLFQKILKPNSSSYFGIVLEKKYPSEKLKTHKFRKNQYSNQDQFQNKKPNSTRLSSQAYFSWNLRDSNP